MKKLITMAVLSFCMTAAVSGAQPSDKDDQQIEKRIEKLVRKMTLEEKVSLLHGNSKFYVSEIKRLGIPEWSLSDGPHGVARKSTGTTGAMPTGRPTRPPISQPVLPLQPPGIPNWPITGEKCWGKKPGGVRKTSCSAPV